MKSRREINTETQRIQCAERTVDWINKNVTKKRTEEKDKEDIKDEIT